MNCRDFREIIDSFLSDELLTETNHEILRHLEECGACREEIDARRSVRTRLRSAVTSAPEFAISPAFERSLRAGLRSAKPEKGRWASFLGNRYGLAAAGLLAVLALGSFYVFLMGGADADSRQVLLASALPASHIVNVAASDHDNCAVKHFSGEPAKQLEDVSEDYRQLASVVSSGLSGEFRECELVDSHTCGYGKKKFSHVVMKNGGKMLSVLVTDQGVDDESGSGSISRFASEKFAISRFDVRGRAVFVISQMDEADNTRAAEALSGPMRTLLEERADEGGFRTALLFAR